MKQLLEWIDTEIARVQSITTWDDHEWAVQAGGLLELEDVRNKVAALIANQEFQYGLRYVDGREVVYPSEEAAAAAQARMRSWPTTKWTKLIRRDYQIGPWEIVS